MKTMSVSENFLKLLRDMMRFTKLELEDLVDCSHELWVEVRGFTDSSVGKESTCNAGDVGSIDPWVRKIPWRREWLTRSGILSWRIP